MLADLGAGVSRKRWVYTSGGRPLPEPIEVDLDWRDPGIEPSHRSEHEIFGAQQAQDGTDISTRRRYRDYMKARGLAHMDDYKEHWAKSEQQRAELFTKGPSKGVREAIKRAWHKKTGY